MNPLELLGGIRKKWKHSINYLPNTTYGLTMNVRSCNNTTMHNQVQQS